MSKWLRERNKEKQDREHEVWRALPEEQKKKEIADRIALYQQEVLQEEQKKQAFKESLEKGKEFNKDVKPLRFSGWIFDYQVSAVAILRTSDDGNNVYYDVAYAVCSRRDEPSISRGLNLAGFRLWQSMVAGNSFVPHPFRFSFNVSPKGSVTPRRLAALIHNYIVMDVVTMRVALPENMHKSAIKFHGKWANEFRYIGPAKKKEKKKLEVTA